MTRILGYLEADEEMDDDYIEELIDGLNHAFDYVVLAKIPEE